MLQTIFQIFSDFIKIIPSPDHQNRGVKYLYVPITVLHDIGHLQPFFILYIYQKNLCLASEARRKIKKVKK